MNIFEQLSQQNNEEDWKDIVPNQSAFPSSNSELLNISNPEPKSGNIFQQLAKEESSREEFNFLETSKDIGQQVGSHAIAGFAGAYGNIADATGLQLPEGINSLPGQEQNYKNQSDLLDRLNNGESLSTGELQLITEDDELPNYARLPTSKEIKQSIRVGPGKTPYGRIAGHGAEFIGEGAATGGGLKALTGLGASGLAGQTLRELGAPEGLATGVEIAGPLLSSGISKQLAPKNKSAQETVKAGRRLGLSEENITPLIQSPKKAATLSKVAQKGAKTKELFESIKEKLGDSYNTIKSSKQAHVNLSPIFQENLTKEFSLIRKQLEKTLKASPDRQAALDFIDQSIFSLQNNKITPEHLVNFWQDINKSVNWNSIQGGKKALSQLKKPISETFSRVAPQLAKDFEMTNDLYSKYIQIAKKLKPDVIDSLLSKGEMLATIPSALSLVHGNPWPLASLAGEHSLRILSREMLINPYFQNVGNKLVKNFNTGSVNSIKTTMKQVKEYMERKHPNEDWSFLTEE